jgi:cbb3-type cytochrome oxidase maturation protein
LSYLVWLVPVALGMGLAGLMAFLWSLRSGQYDDLDGAAERVLLADAADAPLGQAGGKSDATRKSRPDDRNARKISHVENRDEGTSR